MKEMKDRGVLITGGTSGIGLAAARMFLDAGAKVAIAGRNTKRGETALQSLDTPDRVFYFPTDVRLSADCDSLVRDAKKMLGKIDVLVNSAGVYQEESAESKGRCSWCVQHCRFYVKRKEILSMWHQTQDFTVITCAAYIAHPRAR